jgi:hypothetical protein
MRTAILSLILLLPATLQAQNTRRIEPAQSASHSNPILSKTEFRAGQTFSPNQPLDAISASRHRPSVHFRQTNSACMTCMATSCSGFRIAFRTHIRNIQRMVLPVAPQRCQSIRLTKYTGIRAVGFDNPLARAFMAISFTVSLLCHQVFPTGQSC